jgi:hypothetical protein
MLLFYTETNLSKDSEWPRTIGSYVQLGRMLRGQVHALT